MALVSDEPGIAERIAYVFELAWNAGADTDWFRFDDAVPDVPDLRTYIGRLAEAGQAAEALELIDRAPDPRWEPLRLYLQGLCDGAASAKIVA